MKYNEPITIRKLINLGACFSLGELKNIQNKYFKGKPFVYLKDILSSDQIRYYDKTWLIGKLEFPKELIKNINIIACSWCSLITEYACTCKKSIINSSFDDVLEEIRKYESRRNRKSNPKNSSVVRKRSKGTPKV